MELALHSAGGPPRSPPRAAGKPAAPAMVPAVKRALGLLEQLARRREPMSLARLASELALPESSVHGLCSTLVSLGYLRRQPDGAFLIGPRVMGLAEAFVAGTNVAHEFDALWDEAAAPEETVILSVLDGAEVVYVAARNGARPLGLAFNVGMRLPAHLAASGKAMLACQDAEAVRRRVPAGALPRLTGHGSASLAELTRELATTRKRGYAIDDEGVREGVYCYGAPVFDASGQAVAGIGVCIHKGRLGADRGARHLRMLLEVAQRLSQRLGWDLPPASGPTAARPRSSGASR
jgi:IclR family transcriptional regulator, blcABC operon repressor